MRIFFNEESIKDRGDINEIILFLKKNLDVLTKIHPQIKIYSFFKEIEKWLVDWDSYFDIQLRTYTLKILDYMQDLPDKNEPFYYLYYSHNNLTVDNFVNSSMAYAAEEVISGNITAILNAPISKFCNRSFLPILKSPHDPREEDRLINIPCFNNARKIIAYRLLHNHIKDHLSDDTKFDTFVNQYYSFINDFDESNWKPHTLLNNVSKLNPECAFPATTNSLIKEELSNWKIETGSFEEKKANYIKLGGIVLELHGYMKNTRLSSHYGYNIYEGGYSRHKLIVSIDTENGAFEVIDHSGTHIGVYGYDGSYIGNYINQTEINSHSLLNLPTHMFIFD